MPTIHIHLTDAGDVGDLVEHVLGRYRGITIDIDQNDDVAVPAARAATETGPTYHPVIDEVMAVSDRKRDRQWREARQHARREHLDLNYELLISFDCSTCHAVAGKPCRSASGPYKRPYVHMPREQALNASTVPVRASDRVAVVLDEM